MVPKQHKSKRQSASRRYKNEKNAREARRKARKEARKNPNLHQSKKHKDPGIPSLLPFKDKILEQAQKNKRQVEEMRERQKNQRLQLANQNRGLASNSNSIAEMAKRATAAGAAFDKDEAARLAALDSFAMGAETEGATSGRKDNSRRAYYREFNKVLESADVIIQVLDARDPLGCRAREIEKMVVDSGTNKRLVLLLNKSDLVPREALEGWLRHLRNEFPTIAFKASTQQQRSNLGHAGSGSAVNASDAMMQGSECVGADTLIKLLKNYSRSLNMKTSVTVGIIGFPNVGKSSVINSLKRAKVCQVAATPGATKVAQEIILDKNIKLIDCPGIVFARSDGVDKRTAAEIMLRNCVKVELLQDPVAPVDIIVSRCDPEQLSKFYSVPAFLNTTSFLAELARKRGRLIRGGVPNIYEAARVILNDWNTGRISYYTLPPSAGSTKLEAKVEQTTFVNTWSKEFDIDALLSENGGAADKLVLDSTKATKEFKNSFKMASGSVLDATIDNGMDELSSDEDMDGADYDSDEMDSDMDDDDDSDDMDEDDSDAMDESDDDEDAPAPNKTVVQFKQKGGKSQADNYKTAKAKVSTAEAAANKTVDLRDVQKKAAKKQQKEDRRHAAWAASRMDIGGNGNAEDDGSDDPDTDYNFKKYLGKKSSGRGVDKDVDME
ncbi:P-loop containing nucleoside triphosphate hydrolase protein [Ramicandelaber brevisporus]|nr:P-loop containing nucleoside triphosphate hydrolase protein [Ramicandelaber brevisporus]KAI8870881.1 P-loop containing nucleoside triphosphate hydrolase protein [Ramicandelaber brevisporus]